MASNQDPIDAALEEAFHGHPGDTTTAKILDAAFISKDAVRKALQKIPEMIREHARDRVVDLLHSRGFPPEYEIDQGDLFPVYDFALANHLGCHPGSVRRVISGILYNAQKKYQDPEEVIGNIVQHLPKDVQPAAAEFMRSIEPAPLF